MLRPPFRSNGASTWHRSRPCPTEPRGTRRRRVQVQPARWGRTQPRYRHHPYSKRPAAPTYVTLRATKPWNLVSTPRQDTQRSRTDTRDNSLASKVSLLRALADGHARCSRPRRLRAERRIHRAPRLWTSHSTRAPVSANLTLADGHAKQTFAGTARRTHPAQSTRVRTREMLKAPGFA